MTPLDAFCDIHWDETTEEEFRTCYASKLAERVEGLLEGSDNDMTIDMIIDSVLDEARYEIGEFITDHFNFKD